MLTIQQGGRRCARKPRIPPIPQINQPRVGISELIHWPAVIGAAGLSLLFLAGVVAVAASGGRSSPLPTAKTPITVDEAARVEALPAELPVIVRADEKRDPAPQRPPVQPTPEPDVVDVKTAKPSTDEGVQHPFVSAPLAPPTPPACEKHGTKIDFASNLQQAGRYAERENKLLFVLHLSGNFEDANFT